MMEDEKKGKEGKKWKLLSSSTLKLLVILSSKMLFNKWKKLLLGNLITLFQSGIYSTISEHAHTKIESKKFSMDHFN